MRTEIRFIKGRRQHRQSGFTLIELLIANVILILITAATIPLQIQRAETAIADVNINDIYTLGQAAQSYQSLTGTWPDQAASGCANVANVLAALEGKNLIAGITPTSPWGTNYVTSCPGGNRFVVTLSSGPAASNAQWAKYAGSQLFASTVDTASPCPGASCNTVTANFGLPGSALALDNVLWRTDQSPAHPERNQMETNIDMNHNKLNNVQEMNWGTGGTLAGGSDSRNYTDAANNMGSTEMYGYLDFHNRANWAVGDPYSARIAPGDIGNPGAAGDLFINANTVQFGGNDGIQSYLGNIAALGSITLCQASQVGCGLIIGGTGGGAAGRLINNGNDGYLTYLAGGGGPSGLKIGGNSGFEGTYPAGASNLSVNGSEGVQNQLSVGGTILGAKDIQWGSATGSSRLVQANGGSIELGGHVGQAGTGSPYINFYYNGIAGSDVNLTNDANGQLTANAQLLNASTNVKVGRDLNVVRNALVGGDVAAQDFVSTTKNKSLAQSVQDVFIVDAGGSVAQRTIVKPTCPTTPVLMQPRIFTTASEFAEGASASPVDQMRTFATDNGNGTWTVGMTLVTAASGGAVTPASPYGQILAMVKCD